jgi:phenylpropionate dioxygenase-like ring-hydroxylating dioxygenase large terminal subunit
MELVRNTWYFATWAHELGEQPIHRKICGEDVALFRDDHGRVHAVGAVCPHRGANLARGRVVDGALECPYHGWRFSGAGACAGIPSQLPEHKVPPGARVPSYAVAEQQGIVWIWPGRESAPFEEAPRFELFDHQEELLRLDTNVLDTEIVNLMENAFDDSHVHFIHSGTLGVETPILPNQIVEKDPDGRGLTMRWDQESSWGQELFDATNRPGSAVARWFIRRYGENDYDGRHARFKLGGVVMFHVPTVRGYAQTVIGMATPMDEHRTWFTTALRHPMARNPLARPLLRRWGLALNREDLVGTVGLLRPASQHEAPISVQADRGGLAFRRLWAEALRSESGVGVAEPSVGSGSGPGTVDQSISA